MEVIDVFKIPIFREELSIDNQKLLSYCVSRKELDTGRKSSNCGGWQSNNLDKSAHELKDLISAIENCAIKATEYLSLNPPELSNIWININGYKDFNWAHTHPYSTISGVYYIKTPENCGDIEFERLRLESTWKYAVVNFNNYNSETWWFPSQEKVLYMFPSWLKHRVNPNLNKTEERISISFNLG